MKLINYILSIDTSTRGCSVAIHQDGKLLAISELFHEKSSSGMLTTLIEHVVKIANLTYQDLSAIAVAKGPGSYTGLRIGVSTAKGLCYTLEKPLIAINTLEAMAYQVSTSLNQQVSTSLNQQASTSLNQQASTSLNQQASTSLNQQASTENSFTANELTDYPTNRLLCPMIDARRMEVYCAVYEEITKKEIEQTQAKIIDETSFADLLESNQIVFFGDGADKCKKVFEENKNALFVEQAINPSAKTLGLLAFEKFKNQEFEDVADFEPYYLKEFMATTPKIKI